MMVVFRGAIWEANGNGFLSLAPGKMIKDWRQNWAVHWCTKESCAQ